MLQAHSNAQKKPGSEKTSTPISHAGKVGKNAPESVSPDERFERRQARQKAKISPARADELTAEMEQTLNLIRDTLAVKLSPAEMDLLEDFAILQAGYMTGTPFSKFSNQFYGVFMANFKQARAHVNKVMQERQAREG